MIAAENCFRKPNSRDEDDGSVESDVVTSCSARRHFLASVELIARQVSELFVLLCHTKQRCTAARLTSNRFELSSSSGGRRRFSSGQTS